ncbi:MAG: chromosomal replication initiator protein DnaA [Bacteroides sp.]|nr:chromosomal replication initiator protein DnaA [Bacteroides sp.]
MTDNLEKKWRQCLDFIRDNIGETRYEAWFSKTRAVAQDESSVTLEVPSMFFRQQYEAHYLKLIHAALKKAYGRPMQIYYVFQVVSGASDSRVVLSEPHHSPAASAKGTQPIESVVRGNSAPAKPMDPQLNPIYNFENYCTGHSNILAVTIAKTIAEKPRNNDFNPFFLYGDVGIGKTHLIQAIGIRIKEKDPNSRVLYTTARQFQHLYQQAVLSKSVPKFINWFMLCDVLLLDDLQEIAGKPGTSDALFPIFNHLHQSGKQLVFTCDRPPMELDGISDRLIDRFKWGLTERLPRPDESLRRQILSFKARKNGLDFPEEVLDFIATNAVNSIREIEGVVMGILNRSITLNAPITLDLARDVMKNTIHIAEKKPVNFEMLVEATADYFKLNPDTLFSKKRMRDINDARQVLMYLAHKHTGLSSTVIGRKLNRQHGTVLYGISAIKERLDVVPEVTQAVQTIESSLM